MQSIHADHAKLKTMINVLIVNSHTIFRQGLKCLIENEKEMTVIGEALDGIEAIDFIKNNDIPDIIIMDCMLNKLNGIETTRLIIKYNSKIKIICISRHHNHKTVLDMLKAGVAGLLVQRSPFEELLIAIKAVLNNNKYISPYITNLLIDIIQKNDFSVGENKISQLTERETQVLQMTTEGYNTKEIAAMLGISSKTVDAHRKKVMDKLGINNLPLLTKYAIHIGITVPY